MSGITFINRVTGATNNLVYLETTDNTATATASNYITNQAANITEANEGAWTWEANDCIMLSASDGISWCSINSTFTTITAFSSIAGAAGVIQSGASVVGDFPVYSNTTGTVIDSGHLASNIMYKNIVNQMAAGASVLTDKGTATSTAGAATINKQSGVITTEALTTASGSAYSFTLTNSEITTSSIVICTLMGGTNTKQGLSFTVVPSNGSAAISILNNDISAAALNGTLIFGFVVL